MTIKIEKKKFLLLKEKNTYSKVLCTNEIVQYEIN